MQWDASLNAGFSTTTPWLPVADDFARENVANLNADKTSILNLYKALIKFRRRSPALTFGTYEPIAAEKDVLIYARRSDACSTIVFLNVGSEPISVMSDSFARGGEIKLSTYMDRDGEKVSLSIDLRGNEGVIVETTA